VIGAGAAGMAAAEVIAKNGFSVTLIDREESTGGILLQCIHNGFGLHHFGKELTGPEYADEFSSRVHALPVDIYLKTTVIDIMPQQSPIKVVTCSSRYGITVFETSTVILAMGCRERNRGNTGIPGPRPAGIYTAGLAQRLLNIEGCIPGKRAVIVGSGDIGLIMARRLTWTGSTVAAVVEILPHPSGLTRNIVQCLNDNAIPLYLGHAVTNIFGKDRVCGVEIAPLENGIAQTDHTRSIDCDTVLLSVGLIPENELSRKAGIDISPNTGGPFVDHTLQTSVPGIFACGNVLHVHDLVDFG
jgi:NADPH-dependent 2,4-dienoyl-CoA reductase/sulfur reductase-like enzyme